MANFCNCGSIIVNDSCTNKKCKNYKKSLIEPATFEQISYISDLKKQLGTEEDFDINSKSEASKIIKRLKEQLENKY